jgi:putative transposase
MAKLHKSISHKQRGSNSLGKARRRLALAYIHLASKRRDSHFKLAKRLMDEYNVLSFEDLNTEAIDVALGTQSKGSRHDSTGERKNDD